LSSDARIGEFDQPIEIPWHAPVPALVAGLATRRPDLTALMADGRSWTYATLAEHAAGVATGLLDAGLRRGEVVAVTGGRTPELIATMLGVLASGNVLLPMDPALPERRRQLLLAHAGVRRVLDCDAAPTVPARVRDLDSLAARLDPADPAYVVFTSGTTGVPRGVLGRHRGLSHFLAWQREQFAVGIDDRCAQLTGLSFDVVLRDVWLPLTSGAVLCLPPSGRPPAPRETIAWLRNAHITILHAVPTIARSWLTDIPVPTLRQIFFAGEPLPGDLVDRFRAMVSPTVDVVNLYGPTETTLAKSWYRVPDPAHRGTQPVGSPLPQTQIVVLDGDGRPCADGEPGEIVIRTPFRTAGYLDGTGFVANPLRPDPEDLVFRTGDRGVRAADGTLSVLGRLDDQVKINGVRIEPAEVAAALAAHPSVADAAVLGRSHDDGTVGLAGFAVLHPQKTVTGADLRAALEPFLPAVMIPATITLLPRLPVTPNGKLDRAALLANDGLAGRAVHPEPTGSSFAAMAAIWSDVLGCEVSGDDDFFALNGHSLHAATILSRVRKQFGVILTMRTLFERPTLAEFARAVDEVDVPDGEPPLAAFPRTTGPREAAG
jgi:amino acid adenylation domain-containing protein